MKNAAQSNNQVMDEDNFKEAFDTCEFWHCDHDHDGVWQWPRIQLWNGVFCKCFMNFFLVNVPRVDFHAMKLLTFKAATTLTHLPLENGSFTTTFVPFFDLAQNACRHGGHPLMFHL